MSRRVSLPFAVLALAAAGMLTAAWAQNGQAAQEVATVARSISAAQAKGDVPALERAWAEDYTQVSSKGRLDDRKRAAENWRAKKIQFEKMDVKDMEVKVYGDAATTRELLSVKGQIAGKPMVGEERAVRVFNRRRGRWVCVFTQYTFVVPGGE